ncbi:dihydrolipoamide acetyltransferase family protein [Streptomyces sp. NPDC004647]|uniref:dihydrolipoamide acetyltransferase family protein n=1 Tax=Streptomyces sp. NPDC004647 TaxID=3154671 RepID=UPI0033BBDA2B
MAVVREFLLPDLGEGLTEAEIVRWLVQVGDVVAVDQPVVEVETAKAMVEVPCPYGGVVTARFGEEGTELPVGAPLLTVAVGADSTAPDSGGGARAEGGDGDEGSGNVLVGYGTGAPAARRRRVRPAGGFSRPSTSHSAPAAGPGTRAAGADQGAAAGAAPANHAPTGQGSSGVQGTAAGRRSAQPARPLAAPGEERGGSGRGSGPAAAEESGRPVPGSGDGPVAVISPLVRRLAREHGIDLREVRGSGPEGLILRADVEGVARAGARGAWAGHGEEAPYAADATTGPAPAHPAATGGPRARELAGAERIPLRGVRGAVAEKLSRSRREIPDATCWVDADATELLAARAAMQRLPGGQPADPRSSGVPKVSLLALLARICTAALARYPELNSTVDTEAREVVRLPAVHLGFAAQTERGLVVPVVRDAHARNALELTEEFARLTEAARTGRLTPADLTGGTFTLNNYGVFGVDGSTPIINHPEAAMLGVGRIVPKPWVHQGELAVRRVVQLSFTFDHRVCDGGTAGGFLRYVADCVEQPAVLLSTV